MPRLRSGLRTCTKCCSDAPTTNTTEPTRRLRPRTLIDAVRTAREKLEPARVAFGSGVAMANINRRAMDVDGRVSIGLNPDGPVDRQFNLIRLNRPDGSLIALIANYAMHGTVMNGQNLKVSGDGPGVVSAYLEQKLGATVLYVNGAAGNIAPIYSVYPTPSAGHLSQFRVLLGDRILAAVASLGPGTGDVTLRHAEKIVETPRKTGLAWPDELAAYAASDGRPLVRLPIRFVRINDTVIWSAPVEMFCEISMDVRDRPRSPIRFTSATPTAGSDTCRRRRASKRAATSRGRRRSLRRSKPT